MKICKLFTTLIVCSLFTTGCVCKNEVKNHNNIEKKVITLCIQDKLSKEMCDYLLKE